MYISKLNMATKIVGVAIFIAIVLLQIYVPSIFIFCLLVFSASLFLFYQLARPQLIHWLFFFVFFSLMSLLWAENYDSAYGNSLTLLSNFLIAVCISGLCKNESEFRLLGSYIFLSIFALQVAMFYEVGTLFPSEGRYAPLLLNENMYAFFLILGLIFLGFISLDRKLPIEKRIFVFLLYLFLVYQVAFVSGSRKGLVIVTLISVLLCMFHVKSSRGEKKLLLFVLGAVILFTVLIMISKSEHFQRLVEALQFAKGDSVEEKSVIQRSSMIEVGIQLFLEKPIWGWGLYQYRYVSGLEAYSHSNIIEVLANHGLIGWFSYCSYYLIVIMAYLTRRRQISYPLRYLFWSAFISALSWEIAAVTYVDNPMHWLLLGVLSGVASKKNLQKKVCQFG